VNIIAPRSRIYPTEDSRSVQYVCRVCVHQT